MKNDPIFVVSIGEAVWLDPWSSPPALGNQNRIRASKHLEVGCQLRKCVIALAAGL